jgi:hypothetical protein
MRFTVTEVSEVNYTETVQEYIKGVGFNTPIFLTTVKNLVGNNAKMILTRLVKDGSVIRFGSGIYYKPTNTIWGTSALGNDTVLRFKYIEDENGYIKGYITGARLFNRMGLTTQAPRMTEIVSNECKGKNKMHTEYGAIVQRPKVKVDNDNYLYQQLLDVIENKANVQIEVESPQVIIQAFFKDNQLDFTTLYKVGLARGTTERNLHKISHLVLG